MRKKVYWLALAVALFGLGRVSAQPAIPDGVFLRDSEGNTWLVTGGTRAVVPIYEATDEQILALPANDQWVVPATEGLVALGGRPAWGEDPQPVRLTDDPPKVTIQLSATEVDLGATIEVTVIGLDDVGLDWIEWESEPAKDYAAVADPALVTVRRFECDGGPSCTNTWAITPAAQGTFVILARARDNTGQRSDASADLTIR